MVDVETEKRKRWRPFELNGKQSGMGSSLVFVTKSFLWAASWICMLSLRGARLIFSVLFQLFCMCCWKSTSPTCFWFIVLLTSSTPSLTLKQRSYFTGKYWVHNHPGDRLLWLPLAKVLHEWMTLAKMLDFRTSHLKTAIILWKQFWDLFSQFYSCWFLF